MFDEFFAKAHELTQQGVPFATATVVRAEKPTSGKPGDRAIITAAGVMYGWIGGSCAQPTVIKEALKALVDDECRLIRLSTDPEHQTPRPGLIDLAMTCFSGGTLEIYIEPQQPRPRLLIVGTLPVARALVHLGRAMNYHVIVVDPDNQGAGMEDAHEVVTKLDGLSTYVTPLTYVVIATHGNYDEVTLEQVLPQHAPYVGLVASQRRAQGVRDYLLAQGFTAADLHVVKAPAGLDIHARRGDEIALSIMAEIVQTRRSYEKLEWILLQPTWEESPATDHAAPAAEAGTAIDPICGMSVDIATAKYRSVYADQPYYFCCAGCKQKFAAEPAKVVSTAAQAVHTTTTDTCGCNA